jgi:PIN domain nuclease of toxin-antitoxin system
MNMKLLFDTHILLWAAQDDDRLTDQARAMLESEDTQPFFSSVSIWEVAIKSGLGREDFNVDPRLLRRGLLANGFVELPVTGEHAIEVLALEAHHKDPFDRMLVAQGRVEGLVLVTADPLVLQYAGRIIRV